MAVFGGSSRPQFFKGQYGGPLGSYDQAARLLARAGEIQGAATAGLGADIGGAIEKYRLNKEKRDAAQNSLDANLSYMAQNDPETLSKFRQEYAKDFAALEKDGGSIKNINNLNAAMAVWKDRLAADLNQKYTSARTALIQTQQTAADAATAAQRQSLDLQQKVNKSLFDEVKGTRSTMAALTEEERKGFVAAAPGRIPWLERIGQDPIKMRLLGKGVLPVEGTIFDRRAESEQKKREVELEAAEQGLVAQTSGIMPKDIGIAALKELTKQGVEAKLEAKGDGFAIASLTQPDIGALLRDVPGYPGHKIIGTKLYKEEGRELKYVGAEEYGKDLKLQSRLLESYTDDALLIYEMFVQEGKLSDGVYSKEDKTGTVRKKPKSEYMDDRLEFVKKLRKVIEESDVLNITDF